MQDSEGHRLLVCFLCLVLGGIISSNIVSVVYAFTIALLIQNGSDNGKVKIRTFQ